MGLRLTLVLIVVTGCGFPATEVLLTVDSDLTVPDRLDQIVVSMEAPSGSVQEATAELGPSQLPLPRTLGLVHEDGSFGPYTVTVSGLASDALVVQQRARFRFQKERTLALTVFLSSACEVVACGVEETCERGTCRGIDVVPVQIGTENQDASVQPDAGCVPSAEQCGNGTDDDCDGTTDEGFDLENDPTNCGRCGFACDLSNANGGCVAGTCTITSCDPGFGDCNSVPSDGCETNLSISAAHCGMCRNGCMPPERSCCAGSCARSCL